MRHCLAVRPMKRTSARILARRMPHSSESLASDHESGPAHAVESEHDPALTRLDECLALLSIMEGRISLSSEQRHEAELELARLNAQLSALENERNALRVLNSDLTDRAGAAEADAAATRAELLSWLDRLAAVTQALASERDAVASLRALIDGERAAAALAAEEAQALHVKELSDSRAAFEELRVELEGVRASRNVLAKTLNETSTRFLAQIGVTLDRTHQEAQQIASLIDELQAARPFRSDRGGATPFAETATQTGHPSSESAATPERSSQQAEMVASDSVILEQARIHVGIQQLARECELLDHLRHDYTVLVQSRFSALRLAWSSIKTLFRANSQLATPASIPAAAAVLNVSSPLAKPERMDLVDAWNARAALRPISQTPLVSVVIPVYNHLETTIACLRSIADSWFDTLAVQIIIVDDASDDGTAALIGLLRGVDLLSNGENQGFVRSCNRGAAIACGKYICFLNNDTIVRDAWLDELVSLAEDDATIGAVGSKLVYPDGKLQEAGQSSFGTGVVGITVDRKIPTTHALTSFERWTIVRGPR